MKKSWIWSKYKIIESIIGVRVIGLSVMIDMVNSCSLKCPSCPTGHSIANRKPGKMNMDFFNTVMDRIQSRAKIKNVQLYLFGEPMLNPCIGDAVRECKRRGIKRVMISTNLTHTNHLEAVLQGGLDELRISFSGFENGEYFHKGRRIKKFVENCKYLSGISKPYKTKISLIFHIYETNKYELPEVKAFADELGFELIEEPAFFIGWEKIVNKSYTKDDLELINHLPATPEIATKHLPYQEYCYYQRHQLAIDANGKAYLCRHVTEPSMIVGDILKDSVWDILENMKNHSFCISCKNHKLNTFAP